ncbi:MAG: glycine zipper 2TM domain-containing protein [Burkholderiaceae bacterium]|nr:glycine zipper 2TM domain-containing protein [Burkholderiaceae bacterium]
MNSRIKTLLAMTTLLVATHANAQLTFFEREGFGGRSFTANGMVVNFERYGFNDRASSVDVRDGQWEVCEDGGFRGRCVTLRPGRYPSFAAMGLNNRVSSARPAGRHESRYERHPAPPPIVAQITFFERRGFDGRSFTSMGEVRNFRRFGFNDVASSAEVIGERWEVCEEVRFRGRCVVLRPGRYPSLAAIGLNNSVSSTRPVGTDIRIEERRYAPAPVAAPDFRRRDEERIYQVPVSSVRAVVQEQERRCWIEREQVAVERNNTAPGAIAGAVIGGILGHQIGRGTGKDLATVGGALAGAAVGANLGRDSSGTQVQTQDVERCTSAPRSARPDYWEVTYVFRGQEHHVQMTTPPGETIDVNERGEPRF